MNRVDRLFSLVVLLQAHRRLRGEDLARELGVSRRTVYRDVAALTEAGIPVVSLPGQGYELMEGYFLPPVRFTVDEASALMLGARMLERQAAGRIAIGARSGAAKILTLLGGRTGDQVEAVSRAIDFVEMAGQFDLDTHMIAALQEAIASRRVVRLRYHSLSRQETSERDVEPERLTYWDGAWYLTAWCRLRCGTREFRLSRVDDLLVLPEAFERRSPTADEPAAPSPADIEVRVLVRRDAVRWVRERQHYALVDDHPADDREAGDRVFTYRVSALSEIEHWTRAWGAAVTVLSPAELRRSLRAEATQIAQMLA
jgi:predicted DNA-binding transcriptional regulator YafY